MTLFLIVGLVIWLLLGCAIAWVIGSASDLGRLTESRANADATVTSRSHFSCAVIR